MAALGAISPKEVRRLQRGVSRAAPAMLYRRRDTADAAATTAAAPSTTPTPSTTPDAVDVLVARLVELSARPDAAERRTLARAAALRAHDMEAEERLKHCCVGRDGRPVAHAVMRQG